ncbi:hypothetical protein [Frankia sp. CcI49]|uniref:hypothetical protein n=1 Tax=Frankia sp. CcI49 TaxID=1745382 RepID=UPI000975B398|nr:hypothetical protein [Frankia sp. CcI49]
MERSRLLLGWLAARRAVDHCLSDLLAAGPAGERRVRESLARVDDLETRAQVAFDRYRSAAGSAETEMPGTEPPQIWLAGAAPAAGADGAEDGQNSRNSETGRGPRSTVGRIGPVERGGPVDRGIGAAQSSAAQTAQSSAAQTAQSGAAQNGEARAFDAETRNVMPLPMHSRSMTPAGREQSGADPAADRWAPRERPRLNVVREGDLARSSSNTKSNQRHR